MMEKNQYKRIRKKNDIYSSTVKISEQTDERYRRKKKHEEREEEKRVRVKGYCFAIYVDIDTLHQKWQKKFEEKNFFFLNETNEFLSNVKNSI